MLFGDCLIKRLHEGYFLNCDQNKFSAKAFWILLKNTAIEDIKAIYPQQIDSNHAVAIYYKILSSNMDYLPDYFCEVLPSNNQERFRVTTRNLFISNAFHTDGIANHPNISALKIENMTRKGCRVKFYWKEEC